MNGNHKADRYLLNVFHFWFWGSLLMLFALGMVAYDNRQQIQSNTERIDKVIEQRTHDRCTAADSDRWVREFGELNPHLRLPRVRAEFRDDVEAKP